MLDDNRVISISSITILTATDSQVTILMQVNLVTQRNLNSAIVDRRLDVAIIIYSILFLVIGTVAANLQGFTKLLINRLSRIIASELQTVIECGYCMGRSAGFAVFTILINKAGDAILAIGTILANGLDDGGYRVISTVLAGETNLAVITILAISCDCLCGHIIRQSNGHFAVCLSQGNVLACIQRYSAARSDQRSRCSRYRTAIRL